MNVVDGQFCGNGCAVEVRRLVRPRAHGVRCEGGDVQADRVHRHVVAPIGVSDAVQQLPHLVRAGTDEVVLTAMATTTEPVAAVDRACARRREASVWHRIAPAIPEECHDIFEFCFTSALARRNVGDLARHLGVDRSTIALRIRRAGLPPAHKILSWSRLIAVAGVMESTRISVEQAAHEAAFGSAAGLRALSRRMMGATPRALTAGGRRIVMEELLSLLDRCKAYDLVATGGTVQSSDECENNHVTRDAP